MGLIISLIRRKKLSVSDQLDKIENSLKIVDEYRKCTELKQKKLVGNILLYGGALYILACVIVLVWYLPESWLIRVCLIIPFLLGPYIIYIIRKLISKYFKSKMSKANKRYEELLKAKNEIINNIKETEAFNKATQILSKYAPDQLVKKELTVVTSTPIPVPGLRQRTVPPLNLAAKPLSQALQQLPVQAVIQPMFSKNRNFLDKLMEYIVSDGPGYRYALICKHCHGHNGLSVREEYPYMAFNCCYCKKFNPAQSERPTIPVTTEDLSSLPELQASESSEGTDEDELPILDLQTDAVMEERSEPVNEVISSFRHNLNQLDPAPTPGGNECEVTEERSEPDTEMNSTIRHNMNHNLDPTSGGNDSEEERRGTTHKNVIEVEMAKATELKTDLNQLKEEE